MMKGLHPNVVTEAFQTSKGEFEATARRLLR